MSSSPWSLASGSSSGGRGGGNKSGASRAVLTGAVIASNEYTAASSSSELIEVDSQTPGGEVPYSFDDTYDHRGGQETGSSSSASREPDTSSAGDRRRRSGQPRNGEARRKHKVKQRKGKGTRRDELVLGSEAFDRIDGADDSVPKLPFLSARSMQGSDEASDEDENEATVTDSEAATRRRQRRNSVVDYDPCLYGCEGRLPNESVPACCWRQTPSFFSQADGVHGNVLLQMSLVYVVLCMVLLAAGYTKIADDIRMFTFVPFLTVGLCCYELSRIVYTWRGLHSMVPLFFQLVPAWGLIVISREAHVMIGLLFFAFSLAVFLQTSSRHAHIAVRLYTVFYCVVYAGATYFMSIFYSDDEGLNFFKGNALTPGKEISLGEEVIATLTLLFLGGAYIIMEKFIRLYAHFLKSEKTRNESLLQANLQLNKRLATISTPMTELVTVLEDVHSQLRDPAQEERIQRALAIISTGGLFDPVVIGAENGGAMDQTLTDWVAQLMNRDDKSVDFQSDSVTQAETSYSDVYAAAQEPFAYLETKLSLRVRIADYVDRINDWDFDVFACGQWSRGHPLVVVTFAIFLRLDLMAKFKIPRKTLFSFAMRIEEGYVATNPYHNSLHAADVTHAFYYFLTRGGLGANVTELDVVACVVAAMIHDFEHPGVNNNFLVNTEAPLALRYNDRAVLENHHACAALTLMREDPYNIFASIRRDHAKYLRQTIITLVMSTDMSTYFETVQVCENKHAVGTFANTEDLSTQDKHLMLQIFMKAADISNPTKPQHLCKKWSRLITEEFYRQGDKERALSMDVSAFCDRNQPEAYYKSQVGFIDVFVARLYRLVGALQPECAGLHDNVIRNRTMWDKLNTAQEQLLSDPR